MDLMSTNVNVVEQHPTAVRNFRFQLQVPERNMRTSLGPPNAIAKTYNTNKSGPSIFGGVKS